MQRISKKREKEDRHKTIYSGSFHNLEVVYSPLHFQGEFTKINIWFQLLKHKSKRLQTTQAQKQEVSYSQAQMQETSYAQAQKQETSIQTELQRKCLRLNIWYTNQRFGTCKIVVRVLPIFRSSLLYIEVWEIRWKLLAHQNRVYVGVLSNHQWSFAWFGYCPMKEQFQIHSMYRAKPA